MAMLVAVRGATAGYLGEAEKIKWDFLEPETEEGAERERDTLIGAKFGDEMIGALALRLEPTASALSSKKKGKSVSLKGGKGVIRGWTTKLRYRHKGIGTGLLEEAIKVTRERCGKDAELGFGVDHANSKRILPKVFNNGFRRSEEKAIRMLEEVDGGRRKR